MEIRQSNSLDSIQYFGREGIVNEMGKRSRDEKLIIIKNTICRKEKGSSTIEASLIMPFILTIIVLLVYLSFFLYNRVELTADAYLCALRGSRMEQDNAKETYQRMKKESKRLIKGNLLWADSCREEMKVKGNTIHVTYSMSIQIPGKVIFDRAFNNNTWNYTITKKVKKLQPVSFIRKCRKLTSINKQSGEDRENEGNL